MGYSLGWNNPLIRSPLILSFLGTSKKRGTHHPKNQPFDLKLVETGDPEHWLARATWVFARDDGQKSNKVWRVTWSPGKKSSFSPTWFWSLSNKIWEWMYIISDMYMTWKCVVRIAEHAQYGFRDIHRHGEWSLQLHSCGRGNFAQFGHPLTSILES